MGVLIRQIDRAVTTVTKSRQASVATSQMSAIVREQRRQAPTTPGMYRMWSVHAPMVRANIDFLKNACRKASWELVPFSTDLPAPDKGLIRAQYEILNKPNPEDSTFGEMLERIVEDILVLDAGVLEKERRYRGDIVYIHPTMGEFVKVDRFWNGDPRSPRYFWEPDPSVSKPFLNDNMIYQRLHPRTNSGVGISYLETLKHTITALLDGSAYNSRMVRKAIPDGVFDLGETARPDQVDKFKAYFAAELEGKETLAFWGGTRGSKFINFRGPGNSNRDMQFMEWLEWELRITCAVFHTSPQDFAFGFDINKANGQVQQENSESNGALPILEKVQDYLTAEFCQDRMWGGISNNIAFRFRDVSVNQTLTKAEIHKISVAGMPTQTVNEARRDIGLPPIAPPDFDGDVMGPENPYNQLMANTSQGLVLLSDPMTAREMAEREQAPPQIGPGPEATEKMLEKAIRARSESEMRSQLLEIVKASAGATTEVNVTNPPVNIAEGAVQVVMVKEDGQSGPATTAAAEPELIGSPHRETEFISERGQIVGKREVETRTYRPPILRELELAEEEFRHAETVEKASRPAYERKQARLAALREEAAGAKPVVKRIVRETRFELDEHGRVTGKTETEREEDADQ